MSTLKEELIKLGCKSDSPKKEIGIVCPKCGYEHLNYTEKCVKCGAWL